MCSNHIRSAMDKRDDTIIEVRYGDVRELLEDWYEQYYHDVLSRATSRKGCIEACKAVNQKMLEYGHKLKVYLPQKSLPNE